MVRRLLLIYAVVEFAVFVGLTAAIGLGWTLLVLAATSGLGLVLWAPLGGYQLSRQLLQLRSGVTTPGSALSDSALVAVATGLVLVPGLASTVLGLLLLVPPVRSAARPALTAIAMRVSCAAFRSPPKRRRAWQTPSTSARRPTTETSSTVR